MKGNMFRWMRRKCRRICSCRCCLIVTVSLFVSGYLLMRHMIAEMTCKDEESKATLTDLCKLYHDGTVAGSLCPMLCNEKKLQYNSCLNYQGGKIVLLLGCENCNNAMPSGTSVGAKSQLVFKMKDTLEKRDTFALDNIYSNNNKDKRQAYVRMISESVRNSYNFKFFKNMSHISDIISFTWGMDANKFLEENRHNEDKAQGLKALIDSVWSLSEQHEYLMYKMLQDKPYIPNIYGTCGPDWNSDWNQRAKTAVKLIDLVKELDENLHQTLHVCDVKPNNFGLRENGEVTLIDTDCAFFEKDLVQQFNFSNCTKNEDCDFFDCKGLCDISKQKCYTLRANNNLQTMCRKVFLGFSMKIPSGILRNPPDFIKTEFYELLTSCAFPGTTRDSERAKTPWETGERLKSFLQKHVSYS
ncbi:DIK1C-like protein [Mya arenaria]|uniref:DIK1C-like protein n=1 Tax=Mya arenaria TaxID=6604 RepID=A0ABY7ESN2_MYAAR|nr:DIK1C-like protein [Mya arenaria]